MIPNLFARARSLWSGLRRRDALDAEMNDEFRHHMELRAADLVRSGLSPAEAARQARLEFGSPERYQDEGRLARGLRIFDEVGVSLLDFKLGFRMLARYPGLTIIGGLAIAFAIWVGVGGFEFIRQVIAPTLPLDEGHRIVALRNWNVAKSQVEKKAAYDFLAWREELESVRDIGAWRTVERNLIIDQGGAAPVTLAEISPSAFALARVSPLVGRGLEPGDERAGAPPVIVIGHDAWQRRFGGDRDIVGRVVRLGDARATVVGVMPRGFEFPVSHEAWIPLRLNAATVAPLQGPAVDVVARLAPGVSLEQAQAELATLGQRAAAELPRSHEHLRPEVIPYAKSIMDFGAAGSALLMSVNIFLVMLVVLVCGNVALLMFARAASRESEIVVRTALGASRGRLVTQFFAEALVLGGIGAAIGLAAASFGLSWMYRVAEGIGQSLPFWFQSSLSPATIVYAVVLTLLGAVIAGVVPALKVTRGLHARLRSVGAGGGGLKFGGVWTVVIVAQVAVTVAFPVTAYFTQRDKTQIESVEVGFPAEEYLSVLLELDPEQVSAGGAGTSKAALLAHFQSSVEEVERRLAADPGVIGVTVAELLPRMYHPARYVRLDEGGAMPLNPQWPAGHRVSSAEVDVNFFDVLNAPMLAGRAFHAGDLESDHRVAIVNESFVANVLGGRNAIGRRLQYSHMEEWEDPKPEAEAGPWYEIVGVVRDMGMGVPPDPKVAGIYHPLQPGSAGAVHMAIHLRGDPESFAPRLRVLATVVDPALRLDAIQRLDRVADNELAFLDFWLRLILIVSGIALVLSLAGIYAVMSFTVSRRTREIGIRVALGSAPRQVIAAIFRRPLAQIAAGILVGALLAGVLLGLYYGLGSGFRWRHFAALGAYAVFMTVVCLTACVVPTRRALRVQPTEALRADG